MSSNNIVNKLAIIDDDNHWLDLIKQIWEKEYPNFTIKTFLDFQKFIKFEDLNSFKIIITDFYFEGYNLDLVESKEFFEDYKGIKVLVTGYPNAVTKIYFYDKVINKSNISKPTFKFSRHLSELMKEK